MSLLREIDEQAKTYVFGQWLDGLKELDAKMGSPEVAELVREQIEMLNEIGRGDYSAHNDMAQAAGVQGQQRDAGVEKAFAPRKGLGLEKKRQPPPPMEKGQRVLRRDLKKMFQISDLGKNVVFVTDPKEKANPFLSGGGGDQIKIKNPQQVLKHFPTNDGKVVWLWKPEAEEQRTQLPPRGIQH